jgi:hypothetical protein
MKGFSVTLVLKNPAEAERIFSALAENGTVCMPLEETFFAFRFGAGRSLRQALDDQLREAYLAGSDLGAGIQARPSGSRSSAPREAPGTFLGWPRLLGR